MGNDTTNAVKKFAKDLSKAPAPKQMAVGATAGWVAGYLTMKVGKAAATMVGGSLLVLQIAHHKGKLFRYIKDRVRTKNNETIQESVFDNILYFKAMLKLTGNNCPMIVLQLPIKQRPACQRKER